MTDASADMARWFHLAEGAGQRVQPSAQSEGPAAILPAKDSKEIQSISRVNIRRGPLLSISLILVFITPPASGTATRGHNLSPTNISPPSLRPSFFSLPNLFPRRRVPNVRKDRLPNPES